MAPLTLTPTPKDAFKTLFVLSSFIGHFYFEREILVWLFSENIFLQSEP